MTVQQAIIKLAGYNQQAKFKLVVNNMQYDINDVDFSFGSDESGTKMSCNEVSIYLDKLNQNESKHI